MAVSAVEQGSMKQSTAQHNLAGHQPRRLKRSTTPDPSKVTPPLRHCNRDGTGIIPKMACVMIGAKNGRRLPASAATQASRKSHDNARQDYASRTNEAYTNQAVCDANIQTCSAWTKQHSKKKTRK